MCAPFIVYYPGLLRHAPTVLGRFTGVTHPAGPCLFTFYQPSSIRAPSQVLTANGRRLLLSDIS